MRRAFLHFAIACITFTFGTHVTKFLNARGRVESHPATIQLQPAPSNSGNVATAPELLALYRDYAAAQTRHDHAFFERVEAEDFKLFAFGTVYSRAEDIKLMDDAPADLVYTIEDLNVEMKGDAAVISGQMTETDRQGFSRSWRWVDVCVRRGHSWQIQSTTQTS